MKLFPEIAKFQTDYELPRKKKTKQKNKTGILGGQGS